MLLYICLFRPVSTITMCELTASEMLIQSESKSEEWIWDFSILSKYSVRVSPECAFLHMHMYGDVFQVNEEKLFEIISCSAFLLSLSAGLKSFQ